MTEQEINVRYFDYMQKLAGGDEEDIFLLRVLHNYEFRYSLPMDGNRAEDGINLRYRFGHDSGIPMSVVASLLDIRPCSVLEMLISLALRCEEHIMSNSDFGDRTSYWFWGMISNMGISPSDDIDRIKFAVRRFLDREYEPSGEGGLFTLRRHERDLRTVEIWQQLMWYLSEISS